jgi:uncharacterized Zn-finger protein
MKEKKTYQCEICGHGFHGKKNMQQHVHEGKKSFKCPSFESRFTSKQAVNFHISSYHEKKKPFQCSICAVSFTRKYIFVKYACCFNSWKKKTYTCSICDSSFSQSGSLRKHISSVHEGKKPYTCDTCNQERENWIDTFQQCMEEISRINFCFVL